MKNCSNKKCHQNHDTNKADCSEENFNIKEYMLMEKSIAEFSKLQLKTDPMKNTIEKIPLKRSKTSRD